MKLTRGLLSLVLSFSLSLFSFLALPIHSAIAQDSRAALQRGYRTGYSDGYMAGYRDIIDGEKKDPARHGEYSKADRAYNKDYGTIEDYRDGYQQGFESGYDTGYDKRSFEATVPDDIHRRGLNSSVAETSEPTPENTAAAQQPAAGSAVQLASFVPQSDAVIIIPRDTELIIELVEDLGTERSREGDKFNARVVSPTEIAGAIIEGRVTKVEKPGRIKKRSELMLSFDRIVLNESRWANFNAVLVEVMPVRGDNVKRVDDEGAAVGKSTIKDDGLKVGGATGAGAAIGAVTGGPVGAAVGAGVGAAFGVGAVVIERGKHIKLQPNQQLRVKTAYETQIR